MLKPPYHAAMSWARDDSAVFLNAECMWSLTVASEMNKAAAIWAFEYPAAASIATSRSRSDSACNRSSARGVMHTTSVPSWRSTVMSIPAARTAATSKIGNDVGSLRTAPSRSSIAARCSDVTIGGNVPSAP